MIELGFFFLSLFTHSELSFFLHSMVLGSDVYSVWINYVVFWRFCFGPKSLSTSVAACLPELEFNFLAERAELQDVLWCLKNCSRCTVGGRKRQYKRVYN